MSVNLGYCAFAVSCAPSLTSSVESAQFDPSHTRADTRSGGRKFEFTKGCLECTG